MPVILSEHVARAIEEERLSQKQIRRFGTAFRIACTIYGRDAGDYRIQFDKNRYVSVLGKKKPCQSSLYIKRLDDAPVFTSRRGNPTSQLGLAKFISDNGG